MGRGRRKRPREKEEKNEHGREGVTRIELPSLGKRHKTKDKEKGQGFPGGNYSWQFREKFSKTTG